LQVADNGRGIDVEKYGAKIFGLYKTFHGNEDARGVGLFLVKNQIESMRGRIELDSAVGVGSTFKVFFNDEE
jgi:two-component system aerobic respiration control sensor histidine kinase ArcB